MEFLLFFGMNIKYDAVFQGIRKKSSIFHYHKKYDLLTFSIILFINQYKQLHYACVYFCVLLLIRVFPCVYGT